MNESVIDYIFVITKFVCVSVCLDGGGVVGLTFFPLLWI